MMAASQAGRNVHKVRREVRPLDLKYSKLQNIFLIKMFKKYLESLNQTIYTKLLSHLLLCPLNIFCGALEPNYKDCILEQNV